MHALARLKDQIAGDEWHDGQQPCFYLEMQRLKFRAQNDFHPPLGHQHVLHVAS